MEKESFPPSEHRWSIIVNVTQMTACCFPVLLHFSRLFDCSTNFILSAIFISTVSIATAYIWAQVIERSGVLSQAVSLLKSRGLQDAREACFSRLWIVPSRNPMSVSDIAWLVAMKTSGNSVRGALLANASPGFLSGGFTLLGGSYMAFAGEYGVRLERIATALNTTTPIQIFLLVLLGVVCTSLLFNGFFLKFISRGEK